jgi:hypothetical protein
MYLVETRDLSDVAHSLPACFCAINRIIQQKAASMPFLSVSDAVTIQSNLWNYKAK